jgi:hypothetical protein
MSEFIRRILDNDFMANKTVQILIVIAFVVGVLYYMGYFKDFYPLDSITNRTESDPEMEQVDPLDWGFANPKPNSRDLMETRGGRKHWQDPNFGAPTSHTTRDIQASEANFDNSLGQAEPLGEVTAGVVYSASGDQLMRQ